MIPFGRGDYRRVSDTEIGHNERGRENMDSVELVKTGTNDYLWWQKWR